MLIKFLSPINFLKLNFVSFFVTSFINNLHKRTSIFYHTFLFFHSYFFFLYKKKKVLIDVLPSINTSLSNIN